MASRSAVPHTGATSEWIAAMKSTRRSPLIAQLVQDTSITVATSDHEKVSRTELTPLSFLRRSAAVFPDKIAVVHGNRGTSYDYSTFAERVDRLASALQAAGLCKHDRVAFLCPNIPPMIEAHFGV